MFNEKTESLIDIKRFFARKSMHRIMKSTLSLLISKEVDFQLNIGGGSYASDKTSNSLPKVVVGVPEELVGASYKEVYIAILALLGHEGQHILSSNFKEFEKYTKEESKKLINKGLPHNMANKLVHAIGNCVEDGRIERILVNNYPGYIDKIRFLNMYFWNLGKSNKDDELSGLINSILSLSVLGIYPKGYEENFKDSRLDREISKVKPLIFKGVQARTCRDNLNVCREILSILTPYILEMYKEIKNEQDEMQDFMDMLEDINRDTHETSSEEVKSDSNNYSSHISDVLPNDLKQSDANNHKPKNANNNLDEKSNDSENVEPKHDDNNNDKDSKTSNSSNTTSTKGSNNEDKEGKNKDNNSKTSSSSKKNRDTQGYQSNQKEKNTQGDKHGSKGSTSEKSNNNKESIHPSLGLDTKGDYQNNPLAEDEIQSKLESIAKDLDDEISDVFIKANKEEKVLHEEDKEINTLTGDILKEIKEAGYEFDEYPRDFTLTFKLPREVSVPAKRFKKDIRSILQNKSTMNLHGQRKGVLNPEMLYRVGMEDYNIFTIEGNKSQSDYVFYILQDGSGSMSGDKEMHSAYALSIIEEGLKDIVPLKLITFNGMHSIAQHRVIKNWNENNKRSYSYNYLRNNSARGGNDDGISIAVATKELLNRPEQDKVLIVLSDGLPANTQRVKDAVKKARKSGIHVIGIMFGSKEFRQQTLPRYQDMYQRNIIAVSPSRIPNKLSSVLKKILIR